MGQSLEHHLGAIFRAYDIVHVRGAVTEKNQKPDFLFPNAEAYRSAPGNGDACLTMLGAKSTCKDRWRQVLGEAAKIPRKHLLTLEPGISEPQTTPDGEFKSATRCAAFDSGKLYGRAACLALES